MTKQPMNSRRKKKMSSVFEMPVKEKEISNTHKHLFENITYIYYKITYY